MTTVAVATEERYRAFVENTTEGIWRCDIEEPLLTSLSADEQIDAFYRLGFLAEANDAFARMYGFERGEQLVGARLADLLVRDDPANEAYLRAFIQSGYRLSEARSAETDKDGNPRYFSNTLISIVVDGYLIRAWGTQRDITPQVEAEQKVAQLASDLRLITDSAPLLISYVGADLRYRFVNRGYADWFGLPVEEIIGSTVYEVIGKAGFESTRAMIEKALKGERASFELMLPYAEGQKQRFIHGELIPDVSETGVVRGYVAVISDISARREAEVERESLLAQLEVANARQRESLERSEDRFRLMVEGVEDYAIFLLDTEGRVSTWNAGAQRFKGYKAEEIIGQHFSRFYTEEDIARRHPWHELEIVRRDGRYEEEGWRIRKDGTRFWAHVLITALRGKNGELYGFGKVTRDITERREREQERAAAMIVEQERRVLREVLHAVTQGRLVLCHTAEDLPAPLTPAPLRDPISLAEQTLRLVRQQVEEAASAVNFSQDRKHDLITAASECAMNAVQHAGGGTAKVFYDPIKGQIQVWVQDNGSGISLSNLPRATLEAGFSTGGVGIGQGFSLMIACCNRVSLLTGPEGTTVVLEQTRKILEPVWFQRI